MTLKGWNWSFAESSQFNRIHFNPPETVVDYIEQWKKFFGHVVLGLLYVKRRGVPSLRWGPGVLAVGITLA